MFLVLLSLVATASAASQIVVSSTDRSQALHRTDSRHFDMATVSPDPHLLGHGIDSIATTFTADLWRVEYNDSQYIMSMPLTGFEKQDIEIFAKWGHMRMIVYHKSEDRIVRNHISVAVLPAVVHPAGRWTYDGHTIKVTFLYTNAQQDVNWTNVDNEGTAVKPLNI